MKKGKEGGRGRESERREGGMEREGVKEGREGERVRRRRRRERR